MKAMNPGGWKWPREQKWRQKDSWSKQLNPLTIIQDDAMGIKQTSKGCGMTSSIIHILYL